MNQGHRTPYLETDPDADRVEFPGPRTLGQLYFGPAGPKRDAGALTQQLLPTGEMANQLE